MRVLITGGSGLLGSKIAEISMDRGYEVISGYVEHRPQIGEGLKLDLADPGEVRRAVIDSEPDIIFHAAALTDVDKCEIERDLAMKINARGTELVRDVAREMGAFLVYSSTDYVFDGNRGYYREDDPTNPVNCYGQTKLLGEAGCDCVARTSVIYGSRPARGKVNFALWLIERLRAGDKIKIVTDQYITPTLNTNLAKMMLEVGERRLEGTYHMAGATRISRYDFAVEIAKEFGLDAGLIAQSKMSEMNWRAKRPIDSSLETKKAARILEEKPLPLKESLRILRAEIGRTD
ncbi:MAG: dTDP-4-dehydrorhamnose reductase [Methanoculleus marisnigri]|uniref:dTDP-4-dehydrorhamnose reductase n=1 Tax=Methanoculleus marisnigri TaxID=2198 RepID=A0A101IX64_9EURY|nr:MAG: dTDP-4-dehydrorhamnose reductase [Methanoculleus marisnigri]